VSVAVITPSGGGAEEPTAMAGAGLRHGWGVSAERQQAILDTLRDLVPRSGRLSPAQLRAVTVTIVAREELWSSTTPTSAGTCRCTARRRATSGCWPGNAARTPTGTTMADRPGRSR